MREQKRYEVFQPAPLFPDGTEAQSTPEGTVAQGDLAREQALATPPEVTPALLARGREQFGVFCTPCHGLAGDGDGTIVAHGFPKPPSYHEPRLRAAPASHFVDVITRGYGVMYPYAARVEPQDRWAIAAYIRALQLSRRVDLAQVPDAKEKLP
jgi:mono/diheme cytochrome c family protein